MNTVKIYEEMITLPTYGVGEPDKNPMFYEKRVYQGSSGKVYPLPVIDKIMDEKSDAEYKVVWIENEYLKVMIMPELGGRIQKAFDKTNNYDFVYYNQVIKPALVGLAGPWISGGIEFNWPQHHRPTTFSPVDYKLEQHDDGSATVWCNEIDQMYGTKALIGFTLYPDKAYIEISGQLFNPTDLPQTFLWWANPAVAVNDYTKSIFPPDVHAVMDHGKRDVSEFPIAKGEYYKIDYSPGTDISRYKNIPVPTSYMAYHSDYNFVGGYDFKEKAGILHVANHHISPGKKQWTWGHGEFGQAWDRHLTDEDGPYIELMTGVYTDNQPDFTWLMPGEEKFFKQYFMPYKDVGEVKNANTEIMVSLNLNDKISFHVYTTSPMENVNVVLRNKDQVILTDLIDHMDPKASKEYVIEVPDYIPHEINLSVYNQSGELLISYQQAEPAELITPNPAEPSKKPFEIQSNEELFLTGLHLEQYRHATYLPEDYYVEGLKRDDGDIRINNAYGQLLYRRGQFKESEKHFRKAIERLQWKSPNPYDGEALYNLGLALKMQSKHNEAYDYIYKSVWNAAMQNKGYYQLASIQSIKKNYVEALRLVELSLEKNIYNLKSLNLKTRLLREVGDIEEAIDNANFTVEHDILDYGVYYELYKLTNDNSILSELIRIMHNNPNSYLDLAVQYIDSGFYQDAYDVLKFIEQSDFTQTYPMVLYYLGYLSKKLGKDDECKMYYQLADNANPGVCFPNRLMSILVLQDAINQSNLSMASYYLGNLYYDKKVYDKAISLWESSRKHNNSFPTVHRNLGLAYYNKLNDIEEAIKSYEKAYDLNKSDSRVFYELDQLYKRTNKDLQYRKDCIDKNYDVMTERDDFYIEYVQLLNNLGLHNKALDHLLSRQFHVWEGGEGKVIDQYTNSLKHMAVISIENEKYLDAIDLLERAKNYPHNLGEGKLVNAQENDIDYLIGYCMLKLEDEKAIDYFKMASVGTSVPTEAMFYNDARPDSIFYQAKAFEQLGDDSEAQTRFDSLIEYGNTHMDDSPEIDYFAVSLPNFLIFDEDLIKSNKVHCSYLIALGLLGRKQNNEKYLKEIIGNDKNHQGVKSIIRFSSILLDQ